MVLGTGIGEYNFIKKILFYDWQCDISNLLNAHNPGEDYTFMSL